MLVAKKRDYEYKHEVYNENIKVNKKSHQNKTKNNKKLNFLLTISFIVCVSIISASLILVLHRYTSIAETKYHINVLNKEVAATEIEIQQLKAKLDSLTRSDIIEEKAVATLNMQYPKYEQMVFLKSEDKTNYNLSLSENNNSPKKQTDKRNIAYYLLLSLEKIYGFLD